MAHMGVRNVSRPSCDFETAEIVKVVMIYPPRTRRADLTRTSRRVHLRWLGSMGL